ncbi:MAG TPA: hypothetical protein VK178_10870 [Opitutaceae bacterium]|nr:hypothetical protein [Opitutaceae bacterium]
MSKHAISTEIIETGEQRDGRGRRITPAGRRAEHVEAWRRSGLTRAAFARREGLRYPTFAHWVQQANKGTLAPAVRFAQVLWPQPPASPPGPRLEVQLPDGTTVRGGAFEELAALVRALRR